MAPTFMELLLHSARLDQKLSGVEPSIKLAEPILLPDVDDPFGGNENNRRAAELRNASKEEVENESGTEQVPATDEELAAKAAAAPVMAPVPQGPAISAPMTAKQRKAAEKAAKENKAAPSGPPAWSPNQG
jgi:hypothetical protein